MENVVEELYYPLLQSFGFIPQPDDQRYGSMGTCWAMPEDKGGGTFWIYGQTDLFNIKIHDFYLHEDSLFEFLLPGCLGITYYESFSADELSPYRRVSAGCIKAFIGKETPYRVLMHKKIPVRSIGIEVSPAYYEEYLLKQYPNEFENLVHAFQAVDQTEHFPEMVRLLTQVKTYRGEGIAAKLFYEGKVAEAISLMVEFCKRRPSDGAALSVEDSQRIEDVAAYINDHFAHDLPMERLAKIACMGTTKLKNTFRRHHDCTITEYIQQRRVSHAEYLLANTGFSIGDVVQMVGYQNASHFSELFKKITGLLPSEYR
jgi:AraC-like DNA-binding protein